MSPWDSISLSSHIKRQYQHIFELNTDTVTVIKRKNLDGSNFFAEDLVENEIRYQVTLNINPIKDKSQNIDDKAVAKMLAFDCYANPDNYPSTGIDESGAVVNEPFTVFTITDKIEYGGHTYEIEDYENVSFNTKPTLWENFKMNLIN